MKAVSENSLKVRPDRESLWSSRSSMDELWKLVREIEVLCQVPPEIVAAANALGGFRGLLGKGKPWAPTPAVGKVVALGKDIPRKHVVRKHRGGGHEDLVGDDQFLIHHCLKNLCRFG